MISLFNPFGKVFKNTKLQGRSFLHKTQHNTEHCVATGWCILQPVSQVLGCQK